MIEDGKVLVRDLFGVDFDKLQELVEVQLAYAVTR